MRRLLRNAGIPSKTVDAMATRALRTGRKLTGIYATNRDTRWSRTEDHPQFATEHHCKIIFVKLGAQIFCFDNAPALPDEFRAIMETHYLGHPIIPGSYRDKLLLEKFNFLDLVNEGLNPTHGHSGFHIGHENPRIHPRHVPDNIGWRTFRSNLIQGDMTLREARIYFLKLIGRYFELEEIHIAGEPTVEPENEGILNAEEA